MIGRIYGKFTEKQAPTILVDVGGLCYEVDIPMTTLYQLPELKPPSTNAMPELLDGHDNIARLIRLRLEIPEQLEA